MLIIVELQDCLLEEVGPKTIAIMKALKQTLDPQYVLLITTQGGELQFTE